MRNWLNRKFFARGRSGAVLLLAALAVLPLAGCPADTATAAAPGHVPPAATAPPVAAVAGIRSEAPAVEPQGQVLAGQQNTSTQQAKKVQALISRVEASYQSGITNYNANRLDAARLDFDFAVDTMLTSGMDLKNDPVLSDEFDSLLSRINSLEIVALKQGNGFSPKVEAAPAENAEEVTFVANPALVGKVTLELKTTQSDLPLVINQYVAGWIDAYTNSPNRRAHLKASLERAGKYKDMIQRVLRENGVPQDLIYQAVTESGFQPQALNARSGAAGMWQFMPFGGYGLERNGYFDERFDPEKSTIAYAKYIKMLYGMFGDWYLAMAAYDWGPGRVQRVVARTGYSDYWELYRHNAMPAETMAYIPSVIAAIIMAKNPGQYGLADLTPDAPVLSDTVTTNYAISLPLVADLTGATVQEIVALNPAMLRLSTPPDRSYDLHIPPGTVDTFQSRLKDFPEENRASWRFHIVKQGETLDEIAEGLHAHPAQVAQFNDVTAAKPLEPGDELIVPIAASAAVSAGQTHYTTHSSDTLVTVADRFGVSVAQLRAWNHLSSNRIVPGRTLNVAAPIRMAPASRGSRRRSGSSHASSAHAKPHAGTKPSSHAAAPRASHPGSATHSSAKKSSATKPKKQ
jgi:membrane-bound lytic murein transglycosylase D